MRVEEIPRQCEEEITEHNRLVPPADRLVATPADRLLATVANPPLVASQSSPDFPFLSQMLQSLDTMDCPSF